MVLASATMSLSLSVRNTLADQVNLLPSAPSVPRRPASPVWATTCFKAGSATSDSSSKQGWVALAQSNSSGVGARLAHNRPAIIETRLDQVEFVAATRAAFDFSASLSEF
jgi:hypothetical protein